MNVLTSNPDDREDEPLNHLAHRVRLVREAVVLRVLPHDDNPVRLVVVEDLRQVRHHDAMFSQPSQAGHLSCGVPLTRDALLTWQREFDDEVTVQYLAALAECPGANPAERKSDGLEVFMRLRFRRPNLLECSDDWDFGSVAAFAHSDSLTSAACDAVGCGLSRVRSRCTVMLPSNS